MRGLAYFKLTPDYTYNGFNFQGDAEHVSQKLGITKNAWNKRWKRVKTKLDFVTVETVDGPETGTNAEEISDITPEYEELEPVLRPEDSDLPFF